MVTLLAILALASAPEHAPAPAVINEPRRLVCDHACWRGRWQRRHWRRVVAPHRAWLRGLRWCESTGRWHIATGNGYYGAYQFDLQTWGSVGGRGYPHQATPLEQSYRAVLLLHRRGTAPWPVCG
jgi:Transglycosylase-like domain